MSSYVNFFVERRGVYIPIGDYSRSNPMYQVLEYVVPYENMVELDEKIYNDGIVEFGLKIKTYENMIKRYEQEIDDIASINAPFNERAERISEIRNEISEVKEELDFIKAQKDQFRFIYSMRDEWSKVKVFVGIEVGDPGYEKE